MLTLKRADIKVGTTLFFLERIRGGIRTKNITIEKVGRKWAYWGDSDFEKLDLETMQPWYGGYGHRDELWDSEEHYKNHLYQASVIKACQDAFDSYCLAKRKKLTYEKAVKILAILNDESEVQDAT